MISPSSRARSERSATEPASVAAVAAEAEEEAGGDGTVTGGAAAHAWAGVAPNALVRSREEGPDPPCA